MPETLESVIVEEAPRLEAPTTTISTEEVGQVLEKIIDKITAASNLDKDDGTNARSPWKRLGIFAAHERKLPEEIRTILQSHGVQIGDDDTVLELHIPPQSIRHEDLPRSFIRLCEYLIANRSKRPAYLYGVGHLSRFMKAYGFNILNLPESVRNSSGSARILESYAESDDPKEQRIARIFGLESIQLGYISTDEFISRISGRPNYECQLRAYHVENLQEG
jgi:hypothetical protein